MQQKDEQKFKMPQYSLGEFQPGLFALIMNEINIGCPFRAPLPIQGAMGQVSFQSQPCDSTCALFGVNRVVKTQDDDSVKEKVFIDLHCGGTPKEIEITNVIYQGKPKPLHILGKVD